MQWRGCVSLGHRVPEHTSSSRFVHNLSRLGPQPKAAAQTDPDRRPLASVALLPLLLVAAAVMLGLALTSGRYGYHRDELYFIAAGAHPALGYPDQPMLTPLLARAMDLLAPGSLLVLRAPAILASGLTTLLTGLLAREAGGTRRAQIIAASCWAAGAICLVTGHFLTTTTYDVCLTAAASLMIARVLRRGDPRWWLPAGLLLGVGLLNKSLLGVIVLGVLGCIALFGPRETLRSRWLLAGAAVALLGALPYGIWQAEHGFPQRALARSIAADGAEGGRAGFIPFQLLLVGPLLVPVWASGLVSLMRNPAQRALRCFAIAYLAFVPIFIISGGKAYYIAGFYPLLLGVGAIRVDKWLALRRIRSLAFACAAIATAAISALIGLCLIPAKDLQGSAVIALNPDAGEMVGWPRFTATVANVYDSIPPSKRREAVIFTGNYGEAGAIAHFGANYGLPYPYSGHNGWTFWGPPPDSMRRVVLVGIDSQEAKHDFTGCRLRRRIDNGYGLQNDEQNEAVWLCTGEAAPWSSLWSHLRHFD